MGVIVNGRTYDIAIKKGTDEYGMMTALTSGEYRQRANDFAPVIGVPGMQLEYAEGRWRPWTMGDLRGGLGQENWEDPTRFYEMTQGLRIFKGMITLDTQFHDEDASITMDRGVDFKGDHYAIPGWHINFHKDIRKRTTATGLWSTVKTLTQNLTDIAVFDGKCWVSTEGDKMWYSSDGTTWAKMTDSACPDNIYALLPFRNALWVLSRDHMKFYIKLDVGMRWKPQDNVIWIGNPGDTYCVRGAAVIGGIIAIGRDEGIYIYEGSGDRAEGPVIGFENMAYEWNCRVFTVVDGFLYYNVGTRLKRTDLQGAEFDVTPVITGSTDYETYGFGIPVAARGYQGHIYVAFFNAFGSYPVILEMPTIDIGGWRMVYKGSAGSMRGLWFSDVADRLLVNDGATRTQRFQSHCDSPYPDYVQTASLITSWFDAGDVWSRKVFAALLAYARELTDTETISFYYEKDYSGSWVLIGTITSGRETEMVFDPTNIAISARKLRLKIVLTRGAGDSSKTPVLVLPLVASYMVRPDPSYIQQVVIRAQDNIRTIDNQPVEQSGKDLKAFLRACEAYEFPLVYTDRYKEEWDVVVKQTQEIRNWKFTDSQGKSRQEDVMVVTFEEV